MLGDKKSFSRNMRINFWIFFHLFLHTFHDIVSLFPCEAREIITKCDMDSRYSSRAGECPPTRRRRVDEWIRMHHTLPDLVCRDECRDRHDTTTDGLSHRHDIGNDSPVIHSPKLSRPSEPCLDFIRDEEDSVFLCCLADTWPEIIRRDDRSCLPLDGLHHNCCYPDTDRLTDLELTFDGSGITEWHMIDRSSIELTYWFPIVLFSDQRECSHRLSMKSLHRDDESCFFRVHFSELDRSFIRLRTTSREEAIFQVPRSDLSDDTS